MSKDDICFECWRDADDFFKSKNLNFRGYIPNEKKPEEGEFIFLSDDGKEAINIKVNKLVVLMENFDQDLAPFTIQREKDCPQYCMDKDNIENCHNSKCAGCAVRELIVLIKERMIAA